MIRIERTQPAPDILRDEGRRKARSHRDAFVRHAADYRAGRRRFTFDAAIYGAREVKSRLRAMQHDKCAFCESKVTHVAYGDVEHFRPKGATRQSETDAARTPGYYWLAYDWENLLFACQLCNQRHKADLFPLADAARRATDHRADVTAEAPLFLNPAEENSEGLIGFDPAGVPYAVDNDPRADATIRALGLDRPELNARRADRLADTLDLRDIVQTCRDARLVAQAERNLRRRVQADAEYAAMARAALPEYWPPASAPPR